MTTVEIDGIKVSLNTEAFNSYEFFDFAVRSQDPEIPDSERAIALSKCIRIVLGKEHDRIVKELKKQNGGTLSVDMMAEFYGKLCERANALKK